MKSNIYQAVIIICAVIMICFISCAADNNGYTIHREDIPVEGYEHWREYFVSQGKDTLALSVHYRQWKKQRPCLIIDFCQDMKHYQKSKKYQKNTNRYSLCSYQDFLLLLKMCLDETKKDYDLSHIASMDILLLDNLPQIAITVSRQLTDENISSHGAIDNALEHTSLKSDMNKILQNYNLNISKMKSVEMIIPLDVDEYARRYNLLRDTLPERIVGVEVQMSLEEIKTK